jgi:hypothetical protein
VTLITLGLAASESVMQVMSRLFRALDSCLPYCVALIEHGYLEWRVTVVTEVTLSCRYNRIRPGVFGESPFHLCIPSGREREDSRNEPQRDEEEG